MDADRPSVAIVGATGAAGGTLVRVLGERAFPAADLRLFASARGAGTRVATHLGELEVQAIADDALDGVDVAFFAAGAATSRRHAPRVAGSGGVAVDKSSAYRMDPAVPLVVPEVNPGSLAGHRGIVANPNCVAIPLTIVLAPLQQAYGLRHVTVATYQAASGAGRGLAEELDTQARDCAAGADPVAHVYPHVLHGNVVPGGWPMHGADTEEEVKVIAETRRVLDAPDLRMSVTTVRVPVAVGHSAAVWVELDFFPPIPTKCADCTVLRRALSCSMIRRRRGTRPHVESRAATTSRWDASAETPVATTGSRSSSAPTICAKAPRPTPSRSPSCCWTNTGGGTPPEHVDGSPRPAAAH